MKARQLIEVLSKLDQNKRIKFQNGMGWGENTMTVNAIIEQGNAYILIWTCHPYCIKEDLKEGQKLVWYNPNCQNSKLVKDYFPDYGGENPVVYKCLICGRDKFTQKSPHRCIGGFRKRKLRWEEISTKKI